MLLKNISGKRFTFLKGHLNCPASFPGLATSDFLWRLLKVFVSNFFLEWFLKLTFELKFVSKLSYNYYYLDGFSNRLQSISLGNLQKFDILRRRLINYRTMRFFFSKTYNWHIYYKDIWDGIWIFAQRLQFYYQNDNIDPHQ